MSPRSLAPAKRDSYLLYLDFSTPMIFSNCWDRGLAPTHHVICFFSLHGSPLSVIYALIHIPCEVLLITTQHAAGSHNYCKDAINSCCCPASSTSQKLIQHLRNTDLFVRRREEKMHTTNSWVINSTLAAWEQPEQPDNGKLASFYCMCKVLVGKHW